jgi:hypothetical protein
VSAPKRASCPQHVADRPFDLRCQQFKLTWRRAESLHVADGAVGVDKDDEPVFPIQQVLHLFMDAPHVIAKRTAKRHRPHSATAAAVGALRAWPRRNVSSRARAPNVASASAHSVRASP